MTQDTDENLRLQAEVARLRAEALVTSKALHSLDEHLEVIETQLRNDAALFRRVREYMLSAGNPSEQARELTAAIEKRLQPSPSIPELLQAQVSAAA